jgi:hypothetical protein
MNKKRKNEQKNSECELTAENIRLCLLITKLRNFTVNQASEYKSTQENSGNLMFIGPCIILIVE